MTQTAVDYLIEQYKNKGYIGLLDEMQAKEYEKQQIMDAWYAGDEDGAIHDFEHYYNETYKK